MVNFNFRLLPKKAIEYLKSKGFKLTFDYTELEREAHHRSFTVAKVTRLDLLNDIHEALQKAQKSGETFQDFQKGIRQTLNRKGWWGEKELVNPRTGEVKTVNIGSRRLKNIFDTNMRVSYNNARYQSLRKLTKSVYWLYISALLETTRISHRAMHHTAKHRDDSWWIKNKPLNGWGCKCKIRAYTLKALEKMGIKVNTSSLDDIASSDWAYDTELKKVGQLSKLDLSKTKSLRSAKKNKAYKNLSAAALMDTFYNKLGVKDGDMYIDKVGDPMIIDENLFLDKKTKELKVAKEDRHLFLDEFTKVLSDPDEIYLEFSKKRAKKNMFRYFENNGKKEAIMAVFRYEKDKTQGATIYHVTRELENKRKMKLIYKKEDN